MISSKCKLGTREVIGVLGQVLILRPLFVFFSVQFLIVRSSTDSSFEYFPKLPTLIPCLGSHVTFRIVTSLLPSPRDMQSSLVPVLS